MLVKSFLTLLWLFTLLNHVICRDLRIVQDHAAATCQNSNPPRGIYENPNIQDWCCYCLPGTYKFADCKVHEPTTTRCLPCPFDKDDPAGQFYMDIQNNSTQCFKALQPSDCDSKMKTHYSMGSTSANASCDCDEGYYKHGDGCIQHSPCEPGFQPRAKGTNSTNTECEPCPSGSFSNVISPTEHCTPHKKCPPGTQKIKNGTSVNDTVCSDPVGASSNTTMTTASTTTIASVTTTTSTSSAVASKSEQDGSSTGLTIGIVVAIVFIAVIIIFIYCRCCRKRGKNQDPVIGDTSDTGGGNHHDGRDNGHVPSLQPSGRAEESQPLISTNTNNGNDVEQGFDPIGNGIARESLRPLLRNTNNGNGGQSTVVEIPDSKSPNSPETDDPSHQSRDAASGGNPDNGHVPSLQPSRQAEESQPLISTNTNNGNDVEQGIRGGRDDHENNTHAFSPEATSAGPPKKSESITGAESKSLNNIKGEIVVDLKRGETRDIGENIQMQPLLQSSGKEDSLEIKDGGCTIGFKGTNSESEPIYPSPHENPSSKAIYGEPTETCNSGKGMELVQSVSHVTMQAEGCPRKTVDQPLTSKCKEDNYETMHIGYADGSKEINSKAKPFCPPSCDNTSPTGQTVRESLSTDEVDQEGSPGNATQDSMDRARTETRPKEPVSGQNNQSNDNAESEASTQKTPLQVAVEKAKSRGFEDEIIQLRMKNHEIGRRMIGVLEGFTIADVKPYVRNFLEDVDIDDIENNHQNDVRERRYQWIKKIKEKHGHDLTPEFILKKGFELNAIRDKMIDIFVSDLPPATR